MFLMGIQHLNLFCQVIDQAFMPETFIESIFTLEKALNFIVATIKSVKFQKFIKIICKWKKLIRKCIGNEILMCW